MTPITPMAPITPRVRHLPRRTILGIALAGLATAIVALPTPASAADYPAKPIRFIVPYAAGGTTDLVARTVGQRVAEKLGQPVVIENRPGAGGNIGMEAVAKAAPDGYTIGFGAISTNALNPHIYKAMPFDPRRDFTAVSLLGTSTIVLEVGNQLPVKTVAELVAYAKRNPGLTYATAGTGTSMHLAAAMFAQMTGTSLTHVPYKGSSPAINDMLGGHIPVMFDNLPASLPHIQAGKLRALAVAGSTRSPALPNVPTLAEAGLAGYSVEPWFGVYGPAGMPADIVQKLNAAFVEALGSAAVRDKLVQAGFNPKSSSAAELQSLTQAEYEKFGKVARSANITVD
ncbi:MULTISPECIES: tripartite tricarboxylate transporter substrate binding protein [unclassified Cupriavidus]|uniref:Bug family tripartite tricarboxylate transporter substrate binding protein n=1 Tax=unclassified Cupriavidus TaxID=2640874 RepID=UPI0002919C9C|nr:MULTISPECIES: tripartite tricarboxylate transporter substrate binding protein [unclassified Cupriavidus]ESH95094.1 ABC transporter substrate-binding protein [Cupriavidus sp. HPC(L)]MCD9120461.1 tripartite tricarboxylate transporter substrate binding protein [Cupriavidus sp. UGS-1]